MKKNLTFSKLLMLVIMAVLPLSMMAQKEVGNKNMRPAEKYWYIQADGGLSINHGDLASYNGGIWGDWNHFKTMALEPTWNAHFGIGYQFGKVVGLNVKGGYGLLSGHKHYPQELVLINDLETSLYNLDLHTTNYIEGNLNLTFNLFNMFKYNPRRVINLVPHIGFGGIYYQAGAVSQLDPANDEIVSEVAPAAEKRELNFTVPAGMEITFNLAPKFDIFLDYTYLFTGTDALDQVQKVQWMEDKHVINDMDMYSQFNLGLRYKFNNPCDIERMARESKEITYRVNPDPLVEGEDGNVCFDVIVTIPGEYFEKEAVMNLKPYLAYNGGQIDIEPINFVGERVSGQGDFRVPYKEGGEFTKHYCIPYQDEMADCNLMGDPMFYVYDGTIYPTQDDIVRNTYFAQGNTENLAKGVVPLPCESVTNLIQEYKEGTLTVTWTGNADSYDIEVVMRNGDVIAKETVNEPTYSFVGPMSGDYTVNVTANCGGGHKSQPTATGGSVSEPVIEPDFIYFFDYNRSEILGNARRVKEANRIARKAAKELIQGNITSITIKGWASPEGENGLNQTLSDNRAKAAMNDILRQCGRNAKGIEINYVGMGPDFKNFVEMVRLSDLADKDAIVSQIQRCGSDAEKEAEIKRLVEVYPQLQPILEVLRRAEVYINR